ncbi:PrgI family protein [Candidatus Giovannonibacteria bacterium]|nr:PrgI family protein [Candidatus Giovannonibacteria bacterium]
MQYQVPQFIEVEDKIFGPLTGKQFFYILGGGAIIFIMYIYLQLWVVILFGIPVAGLTASLAFLKINGMPFIKVLNNAVGYAVSSRLYLWKKSTKLSASLKFETKSGEKSDFLPANIPTTIPEAAPKLTENKLQDLAWSLDIKQQIKR